MRKAIKPGIKAWKIVMLRPWWSGYPSYIVGRTIEEALYNCVLKYISSRELIIKEYTIESDHHVSAWYPEQKNRTHLNAEFGFLIL